MKLIITFTLLVFCAACASPPKADLHREPQQVGGQIGDSVKVQSTLNSETTKAARTYRLTSNQNKTIKTSSYTGVPNEVYIQLRKELGERGYRVEIKDPNVHAMVVLDVSLEINFFEKTINRRPYAKSLYHGATTFRFVNTLYPDQNFNLQETTGYRKDINKIRSTVADAASEMSENVGDRIRDCH